MYKKRKSNVIIGFVIISIICLILMVLAFSDGLRQRVNNYTKKEIIVSKNEQPVFNSKSIDELIYQKKEYDRKHTINEFISKKIELEDRKGVSRRKNELVEEERETERTRKNLAAEENGTIETKNEKERKEKALHRAEQKRILDERWRNEKEDVPWTDETHNYLSSLIRDEGLSVQLESSLCKETICKLELSYENIGHAITLNGLTNAPDSNDIKIFGERGDQNERRVLVYINRQNSTRDE